MSEELKRYFRGRTGAWVGLILYVVADMALQIETWLRQAPENLGSVGHKAWLELFFTVLAGAIITARGYVSGAWGDAKDGSPARKIYGQQPAPPNTPTAQKGES